MFSPIPSSLKQSIVSSSCPGAFLFILLMTLFSSSMVNGLYVFRSSALVCGLLCMMFSDQLLSTLMLGWWLGEVVLFSFCIVGSTKHFLVVFGWVWDIFFRGCI